MSELDGPNSQMWNSLRSSRPQAANEFSTLPVLHNGKDTGILAAMSADGHPHLLIPLRANSPDTEAVQVSLKGLSIKETLLKLDNENTLVLDASSDPAEEVMFTVVAKELAQAVAAQERDPRKASRDTVKRWRTYWSAKSNSLTFEKALGLFAELYLLNRVLIPEIGPDSVNYWKGPFGERHDFQSQQWHIESKATAKSTRTLQIHGHDQLESPPDKKLLLFCLFASKESGGIDSIEAEVTSIKSQLSNNKLALDLFFDCLLRSGYTSDQETPNLRVRSADFYLVDSTFPTTGIKTLPPGVTKIDWEIDLAQIPAMDELEWRHVIN